MRKTDELKFISLPQEIEEETKEDNDKNKEQEKELYKELEKENLKENDDSNNAGFEVIELYSSKKPFDFFKQNRKFFIIIGCLVFLIIFLLIIIFWMFLYYNKGKEKTLNSNLKRQGDDKEGKEGLNNELLDFQKINFPSKKITVGFLYPVVTSFMISTGEYFVQNGKMNVVFLTKTPGKKEPVFDKNIKRIEAYYNHKEIQKAVKSEKIDFLIVNDSLSTVETNWLHSLGVKIIGVLDNIYISQTTNNKKKDGSFYKKLEIYDAYIQETIEDYNLNLKNLNLKKNIFIPNIYTFRKNQTKLQTSFQSNHTIVAFGGLNDKNGDIYSLINAMPLILKAFPKVKLQIVSQDIATKEIHQLLRNLKLTKNVFLFPLNKKYSQLYYNSSILIFGSVNEITPLAIAEAKANSFPCIISSKIPDSPLISDGFGVIKINISNYSLISQEIIQIFKDIKYRNKLGREAKTSLDNYNSYNTKLWQLLFYSLLSGEQDFQKLRYKIENLYTLKRLKQSDVREPKGLTQINGKKLEQKILTKTGSKKGISKTSTKIGTNKKLLKTLPKIGAKTIESKEKENNKLKKRKNAFKA